MARPSRRELRKFGLVVGGVFVLIGLASWWRGHTVAPRVLWTIGALLVVPGALAPGVLAPVERTWMRMAGVLGHVNARIILTLVFYVVVTPIGMVMRLFRDPLDRRLEDGRPSNWIRRPAGPVDRARYQQQF